MRPSLAHFFLCLRLPHMATSSGGGSRIFFLRSSGIFLKAGCSFRILCNHSISSCFACCSSCSCGVFGLMDRTFSSISSMSIRASSLETSGHPPRRTTSSFPFLGCVTRTSSSSQETLHPRRSTTIPIGTIGSVPGFLATMMPSLVTWSVASFPPARETVTSL